MEKLIWIPLYVDALLASQRWRLMDDYERGWYFSLITESVRSERPGYLKLDRNLWRLAGARSEQFFKAKNAAVMACLEVKEIEGEQWVFSARLVRTLEEQANKYRKRSRDDLSNSPVDVVIDSSKTKEKPRSIPARIPEGFVPKDSHYEIAAEIGINCEAEFQKFRDYYLGTSGAKGVKCDWDATFRNWLRNSINYGRGNGREPTKAEQRVINSRRNIRLALGDLSPAGTSGTGVSVGDPTGPDEGLAGLLPRGNR